MRPTEILMQEHRVLEQVTNCLEIIAQRGEAEGKLDTESANQAIDFLRNFAGRCHHGKEEDCLFSMADQALSEQEQQQVIDFFAHVEQDDMGPGTHQKYLDIATELAKRFDVECQTAGACGCGHK